ncbi:xylose operon transcription regulator XylR, partial [bacterium]|nr:xylose operon transcription regulator XylR [bacterium]
MAVLIEASNAYGRGLLSGIHRHVREHDPWTIFLQEHGRGTPPLESFSRWQGEGVIARIETDAIATALDRLRRRKPLAIVDVSAARLLDGVPYVETDDAAIA